MQRVTYLSDYNQQLWDDTLMMTVLPLAKIGKLLGREEYIAEAKKQCLVHIKYLFDRETGLWFHGWTSKTIVISEIIELLDLHADDPVRSHLTDTLEAQCAALQRLQDASGMWHTLLDHPDSYVEASAIAVFAYEIFKVVRKRYIGVKYRAVAEEAIRAVMGAR